MYFKRLEMHGFKSFAEPAVIEFHEGVTCIVGPNGSGKSNISDAIRWVLGEQSPKMLRGGKMEEVIFAGTASRKSRGMAEVTLVIDNSEGTLPIDYNEVAITRRMYRSGESEYLINNNQCRLRDIRELIMDTGIGVDGYSIIGQGKIADIVGSKPESRREIFEEAAGVVMYKSRKAESERKLASASANLERVNDIISEIEGRIDGLREDSVKAREYIGLRDRFKELEINITLRNIEKLEEAGKTARDDIGELSVQIEKLTAEKKALDEEAAGGRSRADELGRLSDEARNRLLASVEEINTLTSKSSVDAERLSSIDKDLARLQEEIASYKEREERELTNAAELKTGRGEAEKELAEIQKKLDDCIAAYEQITAAAARAAEEADDSRNRMYALYNESAAKTSEARSMESYKESLQQRKEQLLAEEQRFRENEEAAQSELARHEAEKEQLDRQLSSAASQAQTLRESVEKAKARRRELETERGRLQIQISQLSGRKKTIEEMEANYEGYNGAVRFIMKSGLAGIEGVAADLMKVPRGLETAVETALGAAMQNIVCRRDEDAKKAVSVLKENRAGRLTFLPVESIRGSRAQLPAAVTADAGYEGLAAELIEFEARYKGIFDYLLGRTAIVKTMQDAIALSKKAGSGVRFVTLEGEVVNASGAITGGRYKNATANLLERRGEIDKLADKLKGLEAELMACQKEQEELGRTLAEDSRLLAEQETAERELALSLRGLDSRIEAARELNEELGAGSLSRSRQLAAVDEDYANAERMAKELEQQAGQCREQGRELEKAIAALLEKQDHIKQQTEEAAEKITGVRIEKNSLDERLLSMSQMIERIEVAAGDLAAQREARELELSALGSEKQQLISGSDNAEEKIRNKQEEKTALEEYIAGLTKERTELSARLEALSARQAEALEKLNSCQDQKYREEIRQAKNEAQLDSLKEKLWEDFEISYLAALDYRKEDFVMSAAQRESREIRNRLRELGDVNVGAIEEYDKVSERYEFLTAQRSDITSAMEQLEEIIADMEKTIKSKFKSNFDQVVENFEHIFKAMFGGGHAELRLDNEDDPLSAGIEIIAQPPGKKLQNINLMSGGEKTMTAIALMFAVLKTTPTPFCILDEVEAALDDMNIERFAKYLRSFRDIQFAVITHQKATMEYADVLYGVTMPERGISKVLSLRLGDDFEL